MDINKNIKNYIDSKFRIHLLSYKKNERLLDISSKFWKNEIINYIINEADCFRIADDLILISLIQSEESTESYFNIDNLSKLLKKNFFLYNSFPAEFKSSENLKHFLNINPSIIYLINDECILDENLEQICGCMLNLKYDSDFFVGYSANNNIRLKIHDYFITNKEKYSNIINERIKEENFNFLDNISNELIEILCPNVYDKIYKIDMSLIKIIPYKYLTDEMVKNTLEIILDKDKLSDFYNKLHDKYDLRYIYEERGIFGKINIKSIDMFHKIILNLYDLYNNLKNDKKDIICTFDTILYYLNRNNFIKNISYDLTEEETNKVTEIYKIMYRMSFGIYLFEDNQYIIKKYPILIEILVESFGICVFNKSSCLLKCIEEINGSDEKYTNTFIQKAIDVSIKKYNCEIDQIYDYLSIMDNPIITKYVDKQKLLKMDKLDKTYELTNLVLTFDDFIGFSVDVNSDIFENSTISMKENKIFHSYICS